MAKITWLLAMRVAASLVGASADQASKELCEWQTDNGWHTVDCDTVTRTGSKSWFWRTIALGTYIESGLHEAEFEVVAAPPGHQPPGCSVAFGVINEDYNIDQKSCGGHSRVSGFHCQSGKGSEFLGNNDGRNSHPRLGGGWAACSSNGIQVGDKINLKLDMSKKTLTLLINGKECQPITNVASKVRFAVSTERSGDKIKLVKLTSTSAERIPAEGTPAEGTPATPAEGIPAEGTHASNCQDELGKLRVTHAEAAKRWEAEVENALDADKIKFVKLASAQADASNCQDELGKLRVTHAEAANKWEAEVEKARDAISQLQADLDKHKASKAATATKGKTEEELQKTKADLQTVKDEMQKVKDEKQKLEDESQKLFSAMKEKEELSGKLIKADEQIAKVKENMQKAQEQDRETLRGILRNAQKEKEELSGKVSEAEAKVAKIKEEFNKDCATFKSDATCPRLPRCSWTGTTCEVPGVNRLDTFLKGLAAMTVFGICVAFVVMAFLTGAGGGGAINYLGGAGAIAICFLAMVLAKIDDVGLALRILAENAKDFPWR